MYQKVTFSHFQKENKTNKHSKPNISNTLPTRPGDLTCLVKPYVKVNIHTDVKIHIYLHTSHIYTCFLIKCN